MQDVGVSVSRLMAVAMPARLQMRESIDSAEVTVRPFRDKSLTLLMIALLITITASAHPTIVLPRSEYFHLYILDTAAFVIGLAVAAYILLWNLKFTSTLLIAPNEVAIARGILPQTTRCRRFSPSECQEFEVGFTWQSRIAGYDPQTGNYGARALYLRYGASRLVVARGLSGEQTESCA
ncbi:MAG: hypothetical protein ACREQN_16570 [Candidatus Binataceae bacterium]